jgi:hypothetical protein
MANLELEEFLLKNKLYIGVQAYGDMYLNLWVSLVAGRTNQDYMIIVSHRDKDDIKPRVVTRIVECGSIEEMFDESHPLIDNIKRDPTPYLAYGTD